MKRILGIDPGLCRMGWGVIECVDNRLRHCGNGVIKTSLETGDLAIRLKELYEELHHVIEQYTPHEAAVEQTFMNKDGVATLKLAQARGIALLVPALKNCPVFEYAPTTIKKAVVGAGHAQKQQVQHMIKMLLPSVVLENADSADALAVAVCHAHTVPLGMSLKVYDTA
jgi:crossover junction endodeoxyribonuclease RuvC